MCIDEVEALTNFEIASLASHAKELLIIAGVSNQTLTASKIYFDTLPPFDLGSCSWVRNEPLARSFMTDFLAKRNFVYLLITSRFGSQVLDKVLILLGLLDPGVSSLTNHATGTAVLGLIGGLKSLHDYGGTSSNVCLNLCLYAVWIGLGAAF